MEVKNTLTRIEKNPLVMLIYGDAGIGKSTFATTAPRPLIADCEDGTKFFGIRGISVDVAQTRKREDLLEFVNHIASHMADYDTIVIDPIGD